MSCEAKTVFESIEACPGKTILPGIRRRIYFIPKAHIARFPKLKNPGDTGVAMGDLAVYDGDFTLVEGKYFQFMDLKDEASNVTFETVGENGSHLVNNVANAIIAGMEDDVKGFARQVLNTDMVYVYQQRDGKFCVIGNEMFETHTAPAGDTGAEATAATQTTFAINCNDECPVPTYTGKLPISATKQIDCATGEEEVIPGGNG
jgi:hypothetical protein